MKHFLLAMLATLLSSPLLADTDTYKQVGNIKIHYSAFGSSFIQPEIAATYGIVRGKDRGLVNIAVVPDGVGQGQAAHVEGYVSNIFQQQRPLEFFEVREGDAVYYLAPFKFEKEDPLTFKVQVKVSPEAPVEEISFQRILHHEQ